MTCLYNRLAEVYHAMYSELFDYAASFSQYDEVLKKHHCGSVLEMGCGSGYLAPYFIDGGYGYTGLDLSGDMLDIARRHCPGARFVEGDMRDVSMEDAFDAVIISGRSIAYLTANADVNGALQSIHKVLKDKGLLLLDSFKAEYMMTRIPGTSTQEVTVGSTHYKRENHTTRNMETGWTWNWEALYTIQKEDGERERVRDHTVLRAFTEDELRLFLELNGYEVLRLKSESILEVTARKKTKQP